MFLHGLKINITLHLAILIALGMILINLVMITAFQGIFIRSLMAKAHLLSKVIRAQVIDDLKKNSGGLSRNTQYHLHSVLQEGGLECAAVYNRDSQVLFNHRPCEKIKLLEPLVPEAIKKQRSVIRYSDKTWGVFWRQEEYMVIAQPLITQGSVVGGTGMVLHLNGIYNTLRNTQRLFWTYFGINLIVLTLAGLYQFTKITVKPLHRLLKRAEGYHEEGDIVFSHEDKNNEFNRLSSALNRMFMGISKDRETLKETVKSLEKVNLELKQAQNELVRAEKLASVGRLSSGIAHEIGNPIGIVLGYLNLLKGNDLSDVERKDFITRAEDEINRINTVVRQLLDFSKPSTDKLKPVSVNDLLKDLAEVVSHQPFMNHIELSSHMHAREDTVIANPDGLRQVFFNLLLNAADAVSSEAVAAGGRIEISTENINRFDPDVARYVPSVKISVSDNGPGISRENMAYIFDPFFTTKETGKGTGLGLSVSFMIVESMGGRIEAENGDPSGAVIFVLLPLATESEQNGKHHLG